jgi:hypothetical protein
MKISERGLASDREMEQGESVGLVSESAMDRGM